MDLQDQQCDELNSQNTGNDVKKTEIQIDRRRKEIELELEKRTNKNKVQETFILTFEKYIEVYDDKTDKMKKIKVPDVSDDIPSTNLSAVFPMTTTTTSISGSTVSIPLN
jgi:hypothetical protein